MAVTIDSLELEIKANAKNAESSLDSLVSKLKELKSVTGNVPGIAALSRGMDTVAKASSKATGGISRGVKSASDALKKMRKELDKVENNLVKFGFDKDTPTDVSEAAIGKRYDAAVSKKRPPSWANHGYERYNEMVRDALQQRDELRDTLGNPGQFKMEFDAAENAKLAAQARIDAANDADRVEKERIREAMRLAKDEEKFKAEASREAARVAKEMAKEEAAAAKEAARAAKEAQKEQTRIEKEEAKERIAEAKREAREKAEEQKRTRSFLSGVNSGLSRFGSMATRTLTRRAILGAIRLVTDGLKEGTENLYRYSEAMNSTDSARAKTSLDSISTALNWVKNSVGAAAAPLIQSLVPAFQTVGSWAVSAANAINMFISSLQGKTMYTRAKENATDMFDSIKTSAGGASKAAKEARATLLAFDEINRLDADQKGGGGGGGGGGASAVNYNDMFEEAEIELPKWMQWMKDNMGDILSVAKDIGIAFLAWKVMTSTISGIQTVISLLTETSRLAGVLAGGILLAIGVKWSYEGGKEIGAGTANILDYAKTYLGIAASALGGTLLIGGVAGFAIGITVGLVATIVGQIVGTKERLEADFRNSELGKSLQATKETNATVLSMNAALKLNFQTVTGELDGATQKKFEKVEKLIEEIYSLDGKENKTKEELKILKEKIAEVNSMDLEGLRIEFNETTGRVDTTKSAVSKLISELKIQYKTEAMREAYIDAYKDQAIAEENLVKAAQNLAEAKKNEVDFAERYVLPYENKVKEAQEALKKATDDHIESIKKYGLFSKEELAYRKLEEEATKAVSDAQNDLTVATFEAVKKEKEAKEATEEATKAYNEAQEVMRTAVERTDTFSNALDSMTKAQKTSGETSLQYSKDLKDSYLEIQTEAKKAAGAVGDVDKVKMTNVSTQVSNLKRQLVDLGNTKVQPKVQIKTGGSIPTGYYLQQKAAGGYVDQGDLFIANEAGPELIGTVNGRTAVAPNAEITGIANAVYTMGEREIAAINNLTRALNAKDMTAVVTADSIVAGLARKNRRDGVSTVPVSI